jgi:transcriptional regulator with XRE-family HTH domain
MDQPSWGRARTPEELGRLIGEARRAAGMQQADLAELVQVSRMTVSRMERGHEVSMATVMRALSECGYSIIVAPKFSKVRIEGSQ